MEPGGATEGARSVDPAVRGPLGRSSRGLNERPASRARMEIVVVGAGSIGSSLIEMATLEDNHVTVVEKDPSVAHDIEDRYACSVVAEDATDRESLWAARVEDADVVVATTEQDPVNMMVMMLAREMGCESLISVVHDKEDIELFRTLGVNVVENPQRLIAEYIYHTIRRPGIKDFMRVGETAEVFEITVAEGASVAGKSLEEADMAGLLPPNMITVAIDREGEIIVPRGPTSLRPGDRVTIFSDNGASAEVVAPFRNAADAR